jgi:hypothetical protein
MTYKVFLIAALFSFGPTWASPRFVDNSMDRCVYVRDCLCKVTPGAAPDGHTETKKDTRRLSIYFEEDKFLLSTAQEAEIRQFFAQVPGSAVSVIGFADGCGSFEYNKELSKTRGKSVADAISRNTSGRKVTYKVGGENSRGHLAEARRVDVVVHTSASLTTKIDKIPADFYLIDASGSMWNNGWRNWEDVVNASIKPGGKVYLSIMKGCYNGKALGKVVPQGGTEIWWSYWMLLDKMSPGQKLVIISDFESNVPLTSRERVLIQNKVKEKQVEVISIRP